jgi:hypothetical protein
MAWTCVSGSGPIVPIRIYKSWEQTDKVGHGVRTPDDADFKAFFGLLEHPEWWTERDRRTVEIVLKQQRDALAACHREDRRRRASLVSIVEQIEAALARVDNWLSIGCTGPAPSAGLGWCAGGVVGAAVVSAGGGQTAFPMVVGVGAGVQPGGCCC